MESYMVHLEAGQVHVAYQTDGLPVDFWMLTPDEYTKWSALTPARCPEILAFQGTVPRTNSTRYEFTVAVPSSGEYYFAFLNRNYNPVKITLSIDTGVERDGDAGRQSAYVPLNKSHQKRVFISSVPSC